MRYLRQIITLFFSILYLAKPFAMAQETGKTEPVKKTTENTNKPFANKILNFQFSYTYNEPGGELLRRFGAFHGAGGGLLLKTKRNLVYAADATYYFGENIKENSIFFNLTNSSGFITNTGGFPAEITVNMRGFAFSGKFGKIFPLTPFNLNSGIIVMLGAGMFAHHISIYSQRNDVAPLTEDMKKGYDRLTRGPALHQTIGYYFHSKNRFINFYAGFDFTQAFTQSVRGYNYDTRMPDTDQRTDLLWSFKFGWLIPMYLNIKEEKEFYYR
ncbi:MAG: hypothetical protein ACK461_10040 [Bacteroidota bacterium]|jgi:hypothetical protein